MGDNRKYDPNICIYKVPHEITNKYVVLENKETKEWVRWCRNCYRTHKRMIEETGESSNFKYIRNGDIRNEKEK